MPKYSSNLPDMDAILNYDRQIFERNKADRGPEHAAARMGQQQMFRGVEQETGFNPETMPTSQHGALFEHLFRMRAEQAKGQATADIESAKNAREKQEQIETESRQRIESDRVFERNKRGIEFEEKQLDRDVDDRINLEAADLLPKYGEPGEKAQYDSARSRIKSYLRNKQEFHFGKEGGRSVIRPGAKPTAAPTPAPVAAPQTPSLWDRLKGALSSGEQKPSRPTRQGWTTREIQ